MNNRMQEHNQQQGYKPQPSANQQEPKTKTGDYIDFEEVK